MKKLLLIASFFLALFARAQWEPDERLTNDSLGASTSYNDRCIATSGNTIHVVYTLYMPTTREAMYCRSTDEGTTWENDTCLTGAYGVSWHPSIAASGQFVGVVWEDNRDTNYGEIYYKGSLDGGITWGEDIRVSFGDYWAINASVAISDSIVHVVWEDYRESDWASDIYYARSTDWGSTWTAEANITNNFEYSGVPSIVTSGTYVHLFWEDYRDGHGEVYYLRSVDAGATWEPSIRFTNGDKDSWDPCVAVSGPVVHVAYMPNVNSFGTNYDIYYKRSTDNGTSWGEPIRLTYDFLNSKYPCISATGEDIYITCEDYRHGDTEIYYQSSTDGGDTWLELEERLTESPGDSYYSSVMTTDSAIHVLWTDTRDSIYQVYYKRFPVGSLVEIENKPENYAADGFCVYPNPASRQLTVGQLDNWTVGQSAVSGQRSAVKISIMDLYGREIKEFGKIASFPFQMDISDLRDGVYILKRLSEEGKSFSVKFIKLSE